MYVRDVNKNSSTGMSCLQNKMQHKNITIKVSGCEEKEVHELNNLRVLGSKIYYCARIMFYSLVLNDWQECHNLNFILTASRWGWSKLLLINGGLVKMELALAIALGFEVRSRTVGKCLRNKYIIWKLSWAFFCIYTYVYGYESRKIFREKW